MALLNASSHQLTDGEWCFTIAEHTKYPYPQRYHDFYWRLMPTYTFLDRNEVLASFAAHELWHLYTPYRHSRYHEEFDCEAMACRVIRSLRNNPWTSEPLPDPNQTIRLT